MKPYAIYTAALLLGALALHAQTQTEYKFVFSGTAYRTNAAGAIVATHITDKTLLADRARQGNISNINSLSLVYHINGNALGDTVEVISNSTGQILATEFGFYYGSYGGLGRTAVTNLLQTEQRRIDYIYTFDNSTYTSANGDSVGASFAHRRLVTRGKKTDAVINGSMSWSAIPTGNNTAPIVCIGTFSLGRPMF